MYFSMYRIACDYPALKMKLDRATYLKRAYATALGMFNPPRQTWATVARFGAHRPSLRTIQSLGASASVVRCAPRMRPCTSSPNDGVRRRLHLRTAGQQIDFELTGARFAKEEPIQWSINQQRLLFRLETETTSSGEVWILGATLPQHGYKIICGQETKNPP